jgi:hypothetical protein
MFKKGQKRNTEGDQFSRIKFTITTQPIHSNLRITIKSKPSNKKSSPSNNQKPSATKPTTTQSNPTTPITLNPNRTFNPSSVWINHNQRQIRGRNIWTNRSEQPKPHHIQIRKASNHIIPKSEANRIHRIQIGSIQKGYNPFVLLFHYIYMYSFFSFFFFWNRS